ncbi:MAG: hypothetical protein IJQ82_05730, partial [Selenomonadaceae bacterium]|nr:hypothetical protein [Selenomonadaceae bacterium]
MFISTLIEKLNFVKNIALKIIHDILLITFCKRSCLFMAKFVFDLQRFAGPGGSPPDGGGG